MNETIGHYFDMDIVQVCTGSLNEIAEKLSLPERAVKVPTSWSTKSDEFCAYFYSEGMGNIDVCYLLLVDEKLHGIVKIWSEIDGQLDYMDGHYEYDDLPLALGQGQLEDYFKPRRENIKHWSNVDDKPNGPKWYEKEMQNPW